MSGTTLQAEAEILRQREREPRHERDDDESGEHHDQIWEHGARRLLDVAAHDRTTDVKTHPRERHEAADAHGDDQDERIMQFAQAELAGNRYEQRREHIERW